MRILRRLFFLFFFSPLSSLTFFFLLRYRLFIISISPSPGRMNWFPFSFDLIRLLLLLIHLSLSLFRFRSLEDDFSEWRQKLWPILCAKFGTQLKEGDDFMCVIFFLPLSPLFLLSFTALLIVYWNVFRCLSCFLILFFAHKKDSFVQVGRHGSFTSES